MPSFFSTIAIDAAPQHAWEVLTDIEHRADWTPGVKKVTTQTPGGRVGAIYELDQGAFGGMQQYRVKALQAPETLALSGSGTVTYRISTPIDGTARAECTYELSRVSGTIASLTGLMQGQLDEEMEALKTRCGSRACAHPGRVRDDLRDLRSGLIPRKLRVSTKVGALP